MPRRNAPFWATHRTETFYCTIRPLAILSKIFGAFPLANTLKSDGKKVRFSWISPIHIWDLAFVVFVLLTFLISCSHLIDENDSTEVNNKLTVWLILTFYLTTLRCSIQFLFLHGYASRLPQLLETIEQFHQGIGSNLIQNKRGRWKLRLMPLLRILCIYMVLEIFSFLFFNQINGDELMGAAWPVAITYIFVNVWRELPMTMFVSICRYVDERFKEIAIGLRRIKEEMHDKDWNDNIELLRLQHASLMRIIDEIEYSYGMQIATNILFLFADIVLQLFVFFMVTSSADLVLLLLALYFLIMSIALVHVVEKLERSDTEILQELTEFKITGTTRDQQAQIQIFITQLTARPTKMSASGFFNINNAILCSLFGSMATYIIVLVQFYPYFQEHLGNMTLPYVDFHPNHDDDDC